jgi:hypothetical protein
LFKRLQIQSLSNLDNDLLQGLFDRRRDYVLDFSGRTSSDARQYGILLSIKRQRFVLNVGCGYRLLLPEQTEKMVALHRHPLHLGLGIPEPGLQIGNRAAIVMICERGAHIFLHVAVSPRGGLKIASSRNLAAP